MKFVLMFFYVLCNVLYKEHDQQWLKNVKFLLHEKEKVVYDINIKSTVSVDVNVNE